MKQAKNKFENEKAGIAKGILSNLLAENNSLLPKKETEVLRLILVEDKPMQDAAKELKLTSHRVRDLFHMAVARLNGKLALMHERMGSIEGIMQENEKLKNRLKQYSTRETEVASLPAATQKVLETDIADTPFSERVKNILDIAGKRTVKDLVRMSKRDFTKLRNAGYKGIIEIEEYFSSKGLKWNMNV